MERIDTHSTVGQLVADRPARSRVFQELGIDFCCGGRKTLDQACRSRGLDPQRVLRELLACEDETSRQAVNPVAMTLGELADHIEQTHHAYLRVELPRLVAMVRKVAAVHGDKHPWMLEIDGVFAGLAAELNSHMLKEEQMVFPLIRAIERREPGGDLAVDAPIQVMEHEHDDAGNALARMRQLSDGYTPPADACNTFRAMLDGLRELEADMHQHVHKENNILFPRAIEAQAGVA